MSKPTLIAAALLLALPLSVARAGAPTLLHPIPWDMQHADVIVAGTILSFTPDPVPTPQPGYIIDSGTQHLAGMINDHGIYHITRLQLLKGDIPATFDIHLPLCSTDPTGYGFPTRFPKGVGMPILLFLQKNPDGQLSALDPNLPLLPIASDAFKPAPTKAPDAIDLLLNSLSDQTVRGQLAYLVQDIDDPRITTALRPFANDPDLWVRGCALCALARAQDPTAIPLIASAAADHKNAPMLSQAITALQFYKTPAAVPYLNPPITAGPDALRVNAAMALQPIADRSSIPYLVQALDHEEQTHLVAYEASAALHRLITDNTISPLLRYDDFTKDHTQDVAALKHWWTLEKRKWDPTTMPASAPIPSQQR